MRHLLSVVLVVLIGHSLYAQKITVIDSITKIRLPAVTVWQDSTRGAITDIYGQVDLQEFQNADTLHFSFVSYQKQSLSVDSIRKNNYQVELFPYAYFDNIYVYPPRSLEVMQTLRIYSTHRQILNPKTTAAQLLTQSGHVMVQKSQGGGGSPILRGLEANKILLMVDGVRLNNAIYRSGHLQNAITIDEAILEDVDIIYGPAAVEYGNEALGGAIHYKTRSPGFSYNDSLKIGTNASLQLSYPDESSAMHIAIDIAAARWGSLSAISYHKYGDIHIGKNRPEGMDSVWGRSQHKVIQWQGRDSMIRKPDPNILPNTGYEQIDVLQKFRLKIDSALYLTFNFQYSTSSNINRYDKLNDYSGDTLKYADWYYGPQNRLLAAVTLNTYKERQLYDWLSITLSTQRIDEDRINRKYNSPQKLIQEEDVYVQGLDIRAEKKFQTPYLRRINDLLGHSLNYGLSVYSNTVQSGSWYTNQTGNFLDDAQTRYPDGGAQTFDAAVYASYTIGFYSRCRFSLIPSLRVAYAHLNASFKDTSLVKLPYRQARLNNALPVASIALGWKPIHAPQFLLVLSSGYRMPNVDDIGKIRAKDELITVPNLSLRPEKAFNIELETKYMGSFLSLKVNLYQTFLTDAILRDYCTLNGQDSLLYDGENYRIITNRNMGLAEIHGLSLRVESYFDISKEVSVYLSGTTNLQKGHNRTEDVPLGHIPPLFGLLSASYYHDKFTSKLVMHYSAHKPLDEFSPYGEDNQAEAATNGYPAWYTLDFSTGYRWGNLSLRLSAENLLDRHYRTFASGISAPGRCFLLHISVNI